MNETSIATLVAWGVISVFGIGFLIWLTKEEERDDLGGYDERQLLARGKATQVGMIAGLLYLFLLQLTEFWADFPLTMQEVSILGILVMLVTFETVAIWKDAYVRVREKEGIAIAKANGIYKGRQPASCSDFDRVVTLWQLGEITAVEAARRLEISPSTFYRRVKGGAKNV